MFLDIRHRVLTESRCSENYDIQTIVSHFACIYKFSGKIRLFRVDCVNSVSNAREREEECELKFEFEPCRVLIKRNFAIIYYRVVTVKLCSRGFLVAHDSESHFNGNQMNAVFRIAAPIATQ